MHTDERPRMEWRRAWKALRNLIADPARTDQVFEITEALSARGFERAYARFTRHPDGQRLLRERPALLAALSDHARLASLPAGSFGRAYLDFMRAGNLTPEGLVEADAMVAHDRSDEDPDRQFYGERLRDMHDLWHVLTGYGMDEAGEAANLAFTLAQFPNLGIRLIVVAAALIGPKDLRFTWPRYLVRAWSRGRRAAMLPVARYEELLPLPLAEVRQLLHVDPPEVAHPEGIIVANQGDTLLQGAVRSA